MRTVQSTNFSCEYSQLKCKSDHLVSILYSVRHHSTCTAVLMCKFACWAIFREHLISLHASRKHNAFQMDLKRMLSPWLQISCQCSSSQRLVFMKTTSDIMLLAVLCCLRFILEPPAVKINLSDFLKYYIIIFQKIKILFWILIIISPIDDLKAWFKKIAENYSGRF